MDKLWFKAKSYGWGWYPATWQGWAVTLMYALALLSDTVLLGEQSYVGSRTVIAFLCRVIVLTAFLMIICYAKGEKPGWRWGGKGHGTSKDADGN